MSKLRTMIVSLSAMLLLVTGCTSSQPSNPPSSSSNNTSTPAALTPVTFQLNFAPGGFHAGFAVALQNGYYKAEGLDVTLVKGQGSATTAQMVSTGTAKLAYADSVPVMQLIAKGAPMKIVSTIYQANPNQVTALETSGIKSIKDLKGKTIGVPQGGSQTAMVPLLLKANGLADSDVKRVELPGTSLVPSLLQNQVDAILGSMDFYGVQLKERGAKTVDFPFADFGIPTVSTSIIAQNDYLNANGDVVKKFIKATLQGWTEALQKPDAAIAALKKTFPEDVDEKRSLNELTATTSLLCKNGAKFVGKAEPAAWTNTKKILSEVVGLPADVPETNYYTYEYLPSDLPKCR